MIQITDIEKSYEENGNCFVALSIPKLQIQNGDFVSIVGRSGSGKSTFLNIIGGILEPTRGSVWIDDQPLSQMKEKEKCRFRSEKMGFVFQSFLLEEAYTVYQNIEIPLMITNYPPKLREKRIEELLALVGLESKKLLRAGKLSGGEKQRVSIARAIANHPQYIFADEPCGNLDTYNGKNVMTLLRKIVSDGTTVILVTHNLEDANTTDRIIELKDGMVVKDERIR